MLSAHRGGVSCGLARAAFGAALALAIVAGLCAPEVVARTVELTADIDRYIQAEMQLNSLPGVSAALVDSGGVIYLRSHGVRDVESGEPMTPETLVDLASVSKSMTALAVIQLEEQGLIGLDAPVRSYLPDFTLRGAEDSGEITVRHLLRHRSGLNRRSDRAMPCCGMPGSFDFGAIVPSLNGGPLASPVDRSFRYANSNYVLLAAIVERVSGVPFPDYMRARVFEPLGMRRTTIDPRQGQAWGLAGYHVWRWGQVVLSPPRFFGWYGASAVKSTPGDLAKYVAAMLDPAPQSAGRILRREDLVSRTDGGFYDLGWFYEPHAEALDGAPLWRHAGDLWGSNAAIALAPERGIGAVVLINLGAHRAEEIAVGMLARDLGKDGPPAARSPFGAEPDNWAIVFAAGALAIFAGWALYLARVWRQFRRGERRFGLWWHPALRMRAVMFLAMAGFLSYYASTRLPPAMISFPTTIHTAIPMLTGAAILVFLTNAVLTFAPRVRVRR